MGRRRPLGAVLLTFLLGISLAAETAALEELDSARAAGEALLRLQRPDGFFAEPGRAEPNLAHQAMACRALFALAARLEADLRVDGAQAYRAAGDHGLAALAGRAAGLETGGGSEAVAVRGRRGGARLGTNALALLALLERQRPEDLEVARRLGTFLRPRDLASLPPGEYPWPQAETFPPPAEVDPGRAVLALLHLARRDPEGPWRQTAEETAGWIAGVRDLGKNFDELPRDPWLLEALNELHALTGGGRSWYLHARRLAEGILRDRRGESTASRTAPPLPPAEAALGLAAMVRLARREGEAAAPYEEALEEILPELTARLTAREPAMDPGELATTLRALLAAGAPGRDGNRYDLGGSSEHDRQPSQGQTLAQLPAGGGGTS